MALYPTSTTYPGSATFPTPRDQPGGGVLADAPYRRLIRRSGVLEYIRGASGTYTEAAVSRDALVSGTYNPVYYSGTPAQGGNYATNRAGYYGPSSIVSEQEGTNATYSTTGQTISNTDFYRRVTVSGSNITFINCIFRGHPTDPTPPLLCSNASVNPTFIDCTFAPMSPAYNTYCARGGLGGGTFLRCDFYGGSDGFSNGSTQGWATKWNFIQCAFHDMLYFSPDPDAAGGINDNASHTDMIQWGGGKMLVDGCGFWAFYDMTQYQAGEAEITFANGNHMFGNKYQDDRNVPATTRSPATTVGGPSIYMTSVIMFSPLYRNIEDFKITNSYLEGTSYALNVSPNFMTTYGGVFGGPFEFSNNKIGTNHRFAVYGTHKAILANTALHPQMTITGNTDLNTGAPLTRADILAAGA